MQIVSQEEKAALEKKREELYKMQIDVQDRIRKAASLGDLSENAEYHFAKEENRNIQRQLAELEAKLKSVSVVSTDNVPEDVVFLGHTVKLLDLSDDTEQLVRLVGEATPPDGHSDVLPVSVNSPMGEALMKGTWARRSRSKRRGGRWSLRFWRSCSGLRAAGSRRPAAGRLRCPCITRRVIWIAWPKRGLRANPRRARRAITPPILRRWTRN